MLAPGTRLGVYEVVAPLGAGGMGEVYRAHDPRLRREVAIKVLAAELSTDPERLTRFEQEARAAAALNHPNILAVYDIGQHDGASFIVSELLEGETLRERLNGGRLPLRKAIEYAIEICHGLAAAHDKGIVHRDLKPENIFVTADGRVKILDFGLAKLTQAEPAFATVSALPTTPPHTLPGVVLGTIGYMSPEQVRGLAADHRSDIFAFGAILHEMVAGTRAFHGETTMDTMTAILKEAPPDLAATERHIPPALIRIIDKCLEKASAARFQSAGDLGFALEGLSTQSATVESTAITIRKRLATNAGLAWAVATIAVVVGLVGVGATWWTFRGVESNAAAIARLTVALPAGDEIWNPEYPALALSGDGTQLVYVATRDGKAQLYVRQTDRFESRPIAGTEGALMPFFSPDGEWVGFFAQGKLKKVSIAAGAVQVLCDAPGAGGKGGSWSVDNTIYFAPTNFSGIWKVAASGGVPESVTRLDVGKGEVSHRWPQLLPGGKAILFTVWTGPGRDEQRVEAQSLETGERHVVVSGADTGRYVSTGHLVYARADALMAVPMNLATLQVARAAPVPLAEEVRVGGEGAAYAVSDAGVLVYIPGSVHRYERRLVWVDRHGVVEALSLPPRAYASVALSPDGRQAAIEISGGTEGVWLSELGRGILTPLTAGTGSSQIPLWSVDGQRIAYRGTRTGLRNLFWKMADGVSAEERLTTKENTNQTPTSFSSDGKWLAFSENSPETGGDIWLLPLDGERKPQPFVATPFDEALPRFSPDGGWLAYQSNQSGQNEVYVQPFLRSGGRRLISAEGGTAPIWSKNGRELFYLNGEKLMVADVATAPVFSTSTPRLLFEGRFVLVPSGIGGYDVSPDGQRFLRIQAIGPEPPLNQIHIVLNWTEELKRLMPTN